MRLIKIQSEENGAHQYQTLDVDIPVPDGWAKVPDDMELENRPFGEVIAEKKDGVMTVTGWIPGEKPEPDPEPEPEVDPEPTTRELLDIVLGVTE